VLADGMGGARAGEQASKLAAETVVDVFREAGRCDSQVLLHAVEQANQQVMAAAKSDPSLEGMGTTLVVACDMGEEVMIASVGDSRAYLFDGGALTAVTQDQSWVNEVGRAMGLDEDTLRNHPLRHVLTMAIGAAHNLVVNYYTRAWAPGSVVMMSSDGLHGVVEPGEIEGILRQSNGNGEPLEAVCHRLINAARDSGGPDNVTVVLLRRTA
ncbi:MAG: protein phosphatase 2C domain-containing protein, partial [Bryobacteraceae bacterium]